ncbi:unnamed protein product [Schistosoma mattheei]|uniref:Uncharacterized protein n=1 Tax=Schistosoma mattheei TaxID=31246 RepID=A0A183NGU9_9TREM|nr:unnamed protein product [Schistosoma mattheei]
MKGDNTFRFMRYRDEIKRKVVVSFKTNHFDGEDSLDSYFASAVEKWTDSSSSEQFIAFRRKIAPYVLSLKLIIFHQDLICQELKTFWEQLGDTCLPPALDLVANLACDIREDFFNHIDDFLPLVVGAIIRNSKNAEFLAHCFDCLSHLVYFLHRPMVKNIRKILKFLMPLLSHCSSDIPRFTAECLAFLFRKFGDKIALFHTLEEMIENPECLGAVLVEMLSGVGEKVHTTSLEILPCLLDSLFSSSYDRKQSVQLDCDSYKNNNNSPDVSNASMNMTSPPNDCCSVPKSIVAVSYSLSQLVKRSPSSEQINYVIQHLTRQCQRLSTSPNLQYFREYLTLLTSFIQSLAKSEFMSLFEENISKVSFLFTQLFFLCYLSNVVTGTNKQIVDA